MGWQSWEPEYVSDFDNCIFYNAIMKNSNPYDDEEISDLKNLHDLPNVMLDEYYGRSKKIISKMKELGVDTNPSWDEIDVVYLTEIRRKVRDDERHDLVDDIRNVLTTLESKYGVV
tara:strand:+ start:465 stop:812 length:348 start_codon:yes stop_codon:yes gene_type:complete